MTDRVCWDRETILRYDNGSQFPLIVMSAFDKPFLCPRTGKATGTAIQYEGMIYELVEREYKCSRHIYRYQVLQPREIARNLMDYSELHHQLFVAEYDRSRPVKFRFRDVCLWMSGILLSPLSGLMPVQLQCWMEEQTGVYTTTMTMVSAAAMAMWGVYLVLLMAVGDLFSEDAMVGLLSMVVLGVTALYLLFSSGQRWLAAWRHDQASEGPLIGFLVDRLILRPIRKWKK